MKKLLIVLGLVLSQASFASPSSIDVFTSLLPYGKYEGDSCVVNMRYTLKGNLKVTVANDFQRRSFVIDRHGYHRFIPGKHFVISEKVRKNNAVFHDYFFFSYVNGKRSVLIGQSLYSRTNSYDYNVECTID